MDQTQFMGMLIACIATLLGIASILIAIIIKPIINLNKTITKLDATIEGLQKEDANLKTRIDKHGNQIDDLNVKVVSHEVILNNHAQELTTLRTCANNYNKHKSK